MHPEPLRTLTLEVELKDGALPNSMYVLFLRAVGGCSFKIGPRGDAIAWLSAISVAGATTWQKDAVLRMGLRWTATVPVVPITDGSGCGLCDEVARATAGCMGTIAVAVAVGLLALDVMGSAEG